MVKKKNMIQKYWWIILIALVILFMSIDKKEGIGGGCTDSDGNDILTLGTVDYGRRTYSDYCSSDESVIEYTCSRSGIKVQKLIECEHGCLNGVCCLNENCDISIKEGYDNDKSIKENYDLLMGSTNDIYYYTIRTFNHNIFSDQEKDEAIDNLYKYLEQLETTGEIIMDEEIGLYTSKEIDSVLYFTKIYPARVANALYIDMHNLVPWKLKDYTGEELKIIFNHEEESLGWTAPGWNVRDYSVSDSYNYASKFIRDNKIDTVNAIIDDVRKDFRHGVGDERFIDKSLKEILEYYDPYGKRISPHGCWSMNIILASLMKSINIPAYLDGCYLYERNACHGSLRMIGIGMLIHGDDIYSNSLSHISSDKLYMSEQMVVNELIPCGKKTTCATNLINDFYANFGYDIRKQVEADLHDFSIDGVNDNILNNNLIYLIIGVILLIMYTKRRQRRKN